MAGRRAILLLRDILIKSRTIISRTKCSSRAHCVEYNYLIYGNSLRRTGGMRRIEYAGSLRTTMIGRCRSRSRRGDRAGWEERRTGRCRRQVQAHAHNNNNTRNSRTRTRTHARTHALVRCVSDFRSQSTLDSRQPSTVCIRRAYRAPRPLEYVFRVYTI